jgi:hypothetical protein
MFMAQLQILKCKLPPHFWDLDKHVLVPDAKFKHPLYFDVFLIEGKFIQLLTMQGEWLPLNINCHFSKQAIQI